MQLVWAWGETIASHYLKIFVFLLLKCHKHESCPIDTRYPILSCNMADLAYHRATVHPISIAFFSQNQPAKCAVSGKTKMQISLKKWSCLAGEKVIKVLKKMLGKQIEKSTDKKPKIRRKGGNKRKGERVVEKERKTKVTVKKMLATWLVSAVWLSGNKSAKLAIVKSHSSHTHTHNRAPPPPLILPLTPLRSEMKWECRVEWPPNGDCRLISRLSAAVTRPLVRTEWHCRCPIVLPDTPLAYSSPPPAPSSLLSILWGAWGMSRVKKTKERSKFSLH